MHHMAVLTHVYGLLLLPLLLHHLITDRRQHRLLEEHVGSRGLLVSNGFGDGTVPKVHGPVEIGFCDMALAEKMPEICDIPLHEIFRLLACFISIFLHILFVSEII